MRLRWHVEVHWLCWRCRHLLVDKGSICAIDLLSRRDTCTNLRALILIDTNQLWLHHKWHLALSSRVVLPHSCSSDSINPSKICCFLHLLAMQMTLTWLCWSRSSSSKHSDTFHNSINLVNRNSVFLQKFLSFLVFSTSRTHYNATLRVHCDFTRNHSGRKLFNKLIDFIQVQVGVLYNISKHKKESYKKTKIWKEKETHQNNSFFKRVCITNCNKEPIAYNI